MADKIIRVDLSQPTEGTCIAGDLCAEVAPIAYADCWCDDRGVPHDDCPLRAGRIVVQAKSRKTEGAGLCRMCEISELQRNCKMCRCQ